jgi:hypothetical protein
MHKLCLCTAALALAFGAVVALRAPVARSGQEPDSTILKAIRAYRTKTWRFDRVMGRPLAHAQAPTLVALRDAWRSRAAHTWKTFRAGPTHRGAWLCIHRYEGSWTDHGPPYYGGLQMDISFQRAYGRWLLQRKGTADHWTPLEQMWVAEKAYRSGRGFYPWPNTAHYCGLI